MTLQSIQGEFTVCKVETLSDIVCEDDFFFLSKTDRELSVVCRTENVPAKTVEREDGFTMFRIEGQLDFSLVGILANITTILANEKIPVFALSTFDTDYILIKKEYFLQAKNAFLKAGYTMN